MGATDWAPLRALNTWAPLEVPLAPWPPVMRALPSFRVAEQPALCAVSAAPATAVLVAAFLSWSEPALISKPAVASIATATRLAYTEYLNMMDFLDANMRILLHWHVLAGSFILSLPVCYYPGQLTADCILPSQQERPMPTLNRPARALRSERIVMMTTATYGTCPAKGCSWAG